jgi:uncharacterized protein YqhQ
MHSLKTCSKHLKLVFSHRNARSIALIASGLFIWGSFMFFDFKLSVGNLGIFITYTEIALNLLLGLLFGIFLAGQIYKINLMKHKKAVHGTGFFGGFLGILITGCPSCTI